MTGSWPTEFASPVRLLGEVRADRPLIVAAVEEEMAHCGTRLPVLITGMGKVNASVALSVALSSGPRPSQVVNLGTAGALKDGLSGVLEVSRIVQHDLDSARLRVISGRKIGRAHV